MLIDRLRLWVRSVGWPSYDCELCVGQEYWRGCYCAYYEAWCPCGPEDGTEPLKITVARWVYRKVWGLGQTP